MIRRYLLPTLAVAGLAIAVAVVLRSNRQPPAVVPAIQPPRPPFSSYVAGVGVIEASTGNINLGTPVAGVLTDIYVKVGDEVKAGDPLFKIDDRDLQAQLATAMAKIKEAEATLEKSKHRLAFTENLVHLDPNSVSKQAQIDLQDEVAVGEAALEVAKSQAAQLKVEITRRTIHASQPGRILQIRARPGEYAQDGGTDAPLMVLGADARLYVRTDVNESDAWRVQANKRAAAFVRGNPAIEIPLRFEYLEPYVIPKTSLTGRSTERTDVRVLQVLYSFDPAKLPVYIGQQVDVYIEAPPLTENSPERKP